MCKKAVAAQKCSTGMPRLIRPWNCSGSTVMKRLLLRTSLKRPELKRPRYTRNLPTKRVIPRRTRPLYRSFCRQAWSTAVLWREKRGVCAGWLFCCHRQLLYQQRHSGWLLHDQQLHHPLPGFRRYRQYAEITPCDARAHFAAVFMSTTSARGNPDPLWRDASGRIP